MGCPIFLRRTPFSSAARKSWPDSITTVSPSGLPCARAGIAVTPKTAQESKIQETSHFIKSPHLVLKFERFPGERSQCVRGIYAEVTAAGPGVRRGNVEVM